MVCQRFGEEARAVVKSKGNSGIRLATRPLYGYKKAENGDWLIDEPTAAVVQKIFDCT